MMKTEAEIAKYIADTEYEDLPADVVNTTKKLIMDTIGVTIAGSGYSVCPAMVTLIRNWAGLNESTIWVYGDKLPSQNAAMANATMARALDFGGLHDKTVTHANETVIPTAWALAERKKSSGKDLINAVTVGIDVACRLKLGVKSGSAFMYESGFGASAATSKMLELDEEKTLNALGIAFSFAAGTLQINVENASYLHVSHGVRSFTGILSGLLTQQGVTGPKNFLEGDFGLYRVYENKDNCNPNEVTRDLGERFESGMVSLKPYPTCRWTHAAIYGVLELIKEHSLDLQDINEVTVKVGKIAHKVVCVPEDRKYAPQTPQEAQFSIPFLVGVAVIEKDVFIEHVMEESVLKNPDILEAARKVKCYIDDNLEDGSVAGKIEIKTNQGEKLKKWIDNPLGHPDNPLSFDQVADKFKKCSLYAARPLPRANADKMIDMLSNLEQIGDISGLTELMVGKEKKSRQ